MRTSESAAHVNGAERRPSVARDIQLTHARTATLTQYHEKGYVKLRKTRTSRQRRSSTDSRFTELASEANRRHAPTTRGQLQSGHSQRFRFLNSQTEKSRPMAQVARTS